MASELRNNVCDVIETNKNIFLQYEAESTLSMPVEESSESVVVIPTPSKSITDVLINRRGSYPQLKQSASLGPSKQYNAIVYLIPLCNKNMM